MGFVAYQLWFTNLLTARDQSALAASLEQNFAVAVSNRVEEVPYEPIPEPVVDPTPDPDPVPGPPRILVQEAEGPGGEAFAQIRIAKIDLDATIIEGVRRRDLKKGPGHVSGSPLPGQPGNSVISGHRTTYGAPFGSLDELEPGDRIEVETAIGLHVYEVREAPEQCRDEDGRCIVRPTDLWVIEPREGAWLTLTTCHPKFSARRRLIVFAELIEGPNADVILASA
jgi:sortase A